MNNTISITLNENIHCPASYYFCSGYVPELAQRIISIINNYEKNSVYIKSVDMNNNTYNWLFRLFNTPMESSINPLTSTIDKKFIYDYPINITSNGISADGLITFNIGEKDGMV